VLFNYHYFNSLFDVELRHNVGSTISRKFTPSGHQDTINFQLAEVTAQPIDHDVSAVGLQICLLRLAID
jgi:hypothetical protein